jgi:hypothetical protein
VSAFEAVVKLSGSNDLFALAVIVDVLVGEKELLARVKRLAFAQ